MTEVTQPAPQTSKEANPLMNILVNIIIPVTVLNQLSKRLGENGPQIAVVVALLFPLVYGLYDYSKRRKLNMFSVLGLVNVAITGSLAVLALHGQWFVLKEVALPTLLAIAIIISAFSSKPFVQTLLLNDQLFKLEDFNAKLKERQAEASFQKLLKRATLLLSLSFVCSAVINFVLARDIFTDIDPMLSRVEQGALLNQQIAHMTWLAALVILLPSLLFTGATLWYLLTGMQQLSGLKTEELLQG